MQKDDIEIINLRRRLEQYRTQYNFNDRPFKREEVEDLYKRDAEFTAYDIAPPLGGYIGWPAYEAAWSKVLSKYSQINFVFHDDLRVFRRGDVGWTSASADWFGITAKGEKFHKEMRLTLIWVRDIDGIWRVTHEHGSSPRTTALSSGEVI